MRSVRHNRPVPLRKPLAVASLFLLIAALPLLWLGAAHALEPHEPHEPHDHHEAEWSEAAEILVHGHGHAEGTPEHEHHLQPSPSLRQLPPRDLPAPAPAIASLEAAETERAPRSDARPGQNRIRLSGPAPPLLDLLCVLLI